MESHNASHHASYIVTPWKVEGDIDYGKLIKEFGVKEIDTTLLRRLQKYAHNNTLHPYLRRKLFFAHTNLDVVLNEYEKGNKFYLYTGRAPSGPVHLGHLVPWFFTKWLQDTFDVHLLFQIPDEEKFFFKENLTLDDTHKWAYDNILDIIAVGFNPKKTKIFIDTEYAGHMYKEACKVAKKTTFSTAKSLFGFDASSNLGEIFYSCMQSVPAFLPTILEGKRTQCLIPCAVDQDVHFRLTRDVAEQIGYPKPATILCRFLPALHGTSLKMSASEAVTAIYTSDDEKTVRHKIMKYAFSGGQSSVEEHRKKGGNPDIDISYQWLTYFEEDDTKLEKIYHDYKKGLLLTGELKQILVEKLVTFLKHHQQEREKAKKKVEQFMLRD